MTSYLYVSSSVVNQAEALATTKTVLVTGFEPFGQHAVNPSWESVKELSDTVIEREQDGKVISYKLVTRLLPVEYSPATEHIPNLHLELAPSVCIHVGVGHEGKICLERNAFNCGHVVPDNRKEVPTTPDGQCVLGGAECLTTSIDVDMLARKVAEDSQLNVVPSEDAGRYLCNFSYYLSQNITSNNIPVLFVHVPPFRKPYTYSQCADALRLIITHIINSL